MRLCLALLHDEMDFGTTINSAIQIFDQDSRYDALQGADRTAQMAIVLELLWV